MHKFTHAYSLVRPVSESLSMPNFQPHPSGTLHRCTKH
jgi:hypothetical protein